MWEIYRRATGEGMVVRAVQAPMLRQMGVIEYTCYYTPCTFMYVLCSEVDASPWKRGLVAIKSR